MRRLMGSDEGLVHVDHKYEMMPFNDGFALLVALLGAVFATMGCVVPISERVSAISYPLDTQDG
jgi:hypothetical protein